MKASEILHRLYSELADQRGLQIISEEYNIEENKDINIISFDSNNDNDCCSCAAN